MAFIALMSTGVMAQVKCVPDGRGGMCCWDRRPAANADPYKIMKVITESINQAEANFSVQNV